MNKIKLLTASLIILISIFITGNSNAQLLNLTVKGGLNLSDISGDNFVRITGDTKMKTGFNIYVSKDVLNLPVLTLSGEAGYTQKGFDTEFIITNPFGVETVREVIHSKINYIDISVLGKVRIPGGLVFPYILAGPSLGIKAGSSVSSDLNIPFTDLENSLKDFKSTSFGFKFGLGMDIGLPFFSLVAEARYNPDLTTSYDKNNVKIKNKVFEFQIGVKF